MDINFRTLNYAVKFFQNSSGTTKAEPDAVVNANNQQTGSKISNSPLEVKFNGLTARQQLILIRELLNLPKEFQDFLSLLAYNKIIPEALSLLLKEQLIKIKTEDIRSFLDNDTGKILNKLLKLIQQSSGSPQDTDQLNQIKTLMGKIVPSQNATPHQILTSAVIIYLPYYLSDHRQNITLQLEEKTSKGENQDNETLIMYIATVNLGEFKITLTANKGAGLVIDIENRKTSKEKKTCAETILNRINAEFGRDNIPAKTNIYSFKPAEEQSENKKKNISIQASSGISPILIIAAGKISKIIFEFDEKVTLIEKREKTISDN